MFKRPASVHQFSIAFCSISWFTTSNMSCSSTPNFDYPSCAQSLYAPQSPQSSCHSSIDLPDTFINSRSPTPQLAICSASPFPETDEEWFLRMRACIISRVAWMWEVSEEEVISNFCLDFDDPAIIERVFDLETPQIPLATLVRPIFPEPIPIPPCNPPTVILQTISWTPSPLPIYARVNTSSPPPTPSSRYEDLPGAPQIGERPGEDWYCNHGEGIMFMALIPNGDNRQQVTPFICITTNEGDPQLEATLGWGCPVTRRPLYTHPNPYPWPMLTDTQMEVFQGGKLHTPLVNQALAEGMDPTLQAEVYWYRALQKKVHQHAHGVVEARRKFQIKWACLCDCARHLSDANTYGHLYSKVRYDYLTPDQWTHEEQVTIANDLVRGSHHPRIEGCRWCEGRSHDIEQCTSLCMCHFCAEYGHLEQACCIPHTLCEADKVCRVPLGHHHRLSYCVSTICPLYL